MARKKYFVKLLTLCLIRDIIFAVEILNFAKKGEGMSQLTITLDTEDQKVLKEVSDMLDRLRGEENENDDSEGESTTNSGGATTASSQDGDTDADNLPWDARIHSSNRKMSADGRWMKRRNVSPAEFNRIKEELLAGFVESVPDTAAEAPGAMPEPVAAVVPPTPVPEPVAAVVPTIPVPEPVAAVVPTIPLPEPVPMPEPVAAATQIVTFQQLMLAFTAAKRDNAEMVAACKSLELSGVQELPGRPDLIPSVAAILGL